MDNYVIVSGKKYRKGHTTGSCAAAAAKAAVSMLVSGELSDRVEIDTPAGIRLTLPLVDARFGEGSAVCAVVKDGGDDPDVTTGLKIFAEARFHPGNTIVVNAGEGIGVVTLPGLKVEVGKPAINPVPMKMIRKEVSEVLSEGKGVEILLRVPGGDEVAKRTYNPKLGIVGGISILGTSGIVEPMSEEAWKESLALELKVMAAKGSRQAVFIFGNYGENFVTGQLGMGRDALIKVSNFVGYMLDKAVENGFESLLLAGHPGKLIKVAAGIFHTHSRVADARMEIMTAYAALEGASQEVLSSIYECKTTEAAMQIMNEKQLKGVYARIASNAARRCTEYTFEKIRVGTVLFDAEDTLLAMDDTAKDMWLNGKDQSQKGRGDA
jgi:cobalt-precorrin-5B (C1)-methyltransferase